MAENEEPERKVPVFTVIKNGAVLKNIFLVNKPPPPLPPPSIFGNGDDPVEDCEVEEGKKEEILVVGRHPDCHIMLTHPSVSRFHLQIQSKPASLNLSVTDLSSVHGTWVSGKKIEACVPVELHEGDTLRVGGSTRVYRLHWIPTSQAYDMDDPFVSPLDVPMEDVKPEEVELFVNENKLEALKGEKSESIEIGESEVRDSLVVEPKEEETCQVLNSLLIEEFRHDEGLDSLVVEGKEGICQDGISVSVENEEIQLLDWTLEGIVLLFSEEKSEFIPKTEIQSSGTESMDLICPAGGNTSVLEELQFDQHDQIICHDSMTEIISERENPESSLRRSEKEESEVLVNLVALPSNEKQCKTADETENQSPLQVETEIVNNLEIMKESENSYLISGVLSEMKAEQVNKENQTLQSLIVLQSLEGEMKEESSLDQNLSLSVTLNTASFNEECYLAAELFKAENTCLAREGHGQNGFCSALLEAESVNSSMPLGEVLSEITDNKNIPTPQSMFVPERFRDQENSEVSPLRSDKKSSLHSIWSRRGKPSFNEECYLAAELFKAENTCLAREGHGQNGFCSALLEAESVNSSMPLGEVLSEITDNKNIPTPQSMFVPERFRDQENSEVSPLRSDKKSSLHSIWSRRGKPASVLQIQTGRSRGKITGGQNNDDVQLQKNIPTPQSMFVPERFRDQENSEVSPLRSDKKSSLHSIWSRRGKPASVLQIQTGRSRGKITGGQNNDDVQLQKQEDIEYKSISKELFLDSEEREEEIFTPDKENFSPDTLLLNSFKRKCKQEDTKHSRSCRKSCSKVTVSPIIQLEEDSIFSSDKENQTPKVLQEKKIARHTSRNKIKLEEERILMKKRPERVPFQTLVANSPGQRRSEDSFLNATTRSRNSANFTRTMKRVANSSSLIGEGRRSWAMVADATTLLDKESRKSLQLLQGLRGTQLIIPRMVIRELDCLKRRGSLFRRTTEVSSLLEWIEECMVKTKWWIHIQSSVEVGRQIAPTPPASPKSLFSEGNSGGFSCETASWGAFSSHISLTEIVSPTAEDHILDCALLFRKMKNDGQLVLLSNDVTLKIKAMAEGLLCETAEEFRESLVNPFSERFLWADSSPRGLTWSYLDDEVLREKYRRGPLKKPSKGGDGAKGLKLILLHNSHYAQMSSVR